MHADGGIFPVSGNNDGNDRDGSSGLPDADMTLDDDPVHAAINYSYNCSYIYTSTIIDKIISYTCGS